MGSSKETFCSWSVSIFFPEEKLELWNFLGIEASKAFDGQSLEASIEDMNIFNQVTLTGERLCWVVFSRHHCAFHGEQEETPLRIKSKVFLMPQSRLKHFPLTFKSFFARRELQTLQRLRKRPNAQEILMHLYGSHAYHRAQGRSRMALWHIEPFQVKSFDKEILRLHFYSFGHLRKWVKGGIFMEEGPALLLTEILAALGIRVAVLCGPGVEAQGNAYVDYNLYLSQPAENLTAFTFSSWLRKQCFFATKYYYHSKAHEA